MGGEPKVLDRFPMEGSLIEPWNNPPYTAPIEANSVYGAVVLKAVCFDDPNKLFGDFDDMVDIYQAIPNVVVRAFQLQPRQSDDQLNKEQQATNKAYAEEKIWKLVGQTITDSNGHYAIKGCLIPGYKTFIEA